MMRVLFVGDGFREAKVLPSLILNLLGSIRLNIADSGVAAIDPKDIMLSSEQEPPGEIRGSEFRAWHAIRVGGFHRKLAYVLLAARDRRHDGVVAVVDRDTAGKHERLKKMKKGRDTVRRSQSAIPTALGEADPHGESWLMDDQQAVRTTLRLPNDREVPKVSKCNPKAALNELFEDCPRSHEDWHELLAEIAGCIDPKKCLSQRETGLKAFIQELRDEFRTQQ